MMGRSFINLKYPEAVTPLEETIGRERSKSAFELFVEFIIGTNDESQ